MGFLVWIFLGIITLYVSQQHPDETEDLLPQKRFYLWLGLFFMGMGLFT